MKKEPESGGLTTDVELRLALDACHARIEELEREASTVVPLLQKLASYEKALETTHAGVTFTDKNGTIIYTNPAEARMHGYDSPQELIGQDVRVFAPRELWNPMSPEDVVKRGRFNRESVNLRQDGTEFPVLLVSDLVRGDDGEALGVVAICQDISERKEAENELRRAFAELEIQAQESEAELSHALKQLNQRIIAQKASEVEKQQLQASLQQAQKMEAIGLLAGGVAHDFNNILTAIIGNSSLLSLRIENDSPMCHDLQQILEAAERGASLTQRLLTLSRRQTIAAKQTDLNGLITNVKEMLRRLIGEDIKLTATLADEPIMATVDRGQIEQVIINLTTNARDAMNVGGELEIGVEKMALEKRYAKYQLLLEPGNYACITVRDNGIGMEKGCLDKIFEPFYTTKPPGRGTGLGLAVSYGIVKQHGGAIGVYSEPNLGSLFRVYLPLARGPEVAEIEDLAEPDGGTETILVAEDDEAVLKMTSELLTIYGYHVIKAEDGQVAVDQFRRNENRIDALLLDTVMPEKSGPQVADEIERMAPGTPVLLMSGYTADALRSKGIGEEAVNLLQKPYNPRELLTRIRQLLDA